MDVDTFIDRPLPLQKFATDEEREAVRYAKFVLSLLRYPASLRLDVEQFIPRLYCMHEGKRWQVVHASHMGYVGLTDDLWTKGVQQIKKSVDVSECSDWRATS